MKIKISILKMFMLLSIFIFVFYTMFYQHVVGEIEGILAILYIVMFFLSVISTTRNIVIVNNFKWVFLFLAFAFVSGFFFSDDGGKELFKELILRIVSYCIVMYCIACYVEYKKKNLTTIMLMIWASALALAISTFLIGNETSTYYGGISIGELNKNILSCYITIGTLANIYLFYETKTKWKQVFLIFTIGIEIIAQFNTASRTGAISAFILVFSFIHTTYSIKDEKKWKSRIALVFIILIGILWIVLNFTKITDMFIVFDRFRGLYTTGDSVRRYLQSVAWNIFLDNPIFGKGFGCVSKECGTYSHSFYYEVLASMGIVGSFILIVPLLKYMITFFKISCLRSENLENRLLARLMSWSILLVFVTGIAQIYIYYFFFYTYIVIWVSTYSVIYTNKMLQ